MIRVAFCVGEYPEEERRRRIDVALSYSSEEVEVGIVDVPATPYHGLGPARKSRGCTPFFTRSFVRAEREGYDAVVPLGMLDLGVDGGPSLVEIPVASDRRRPRCTWLHCSATASD